MIRRLIFLSLLWLLPACAEAARTILVFGDSISAGYGLDAGTGWVALLSQRLKTLGAPYEVINASVSGETTAGGISRLGDALKLYKPAVVLLELGANDGLRGQPPTVMQGNLETMIDMARAGGAQPLLFEMRMPNNYGPAYTQRFDQSFHNAAAARKIPLVPFFLGAVAADADHWFQDDGIHPNAAAQPQLLDAVWGSLAPAIGLAGKNVAASKPPPHP